MKLRRLGTLFLLGALLIACGGTGGDGSVTTSEVGPIHVHGLGVNPSDQALFVATHTGLYRIPQGATEASRVGDDYQDTMGFTVIGPDHFLGSGHPNGGDLPPFLGLIESDSAGRDWEPVSLLGKADFHVLEAAGDRIYGFGSDFETRREQLLVSDDGGERWQERPFPESVLSIAIDPKDPDHVIASGQRSLYESDNAGGSWEPLSGEPGLIGWPETAPPYRVDQDGTVFASSRVAGRWRELGSLGERPVAFEAQSVDELYAALEDGSIAQSGDGGRTWELHSSP